MMAPVLIALAAAPILVALWVVAWLVGDLFAAPVSAPVRVRFRDHRGR
jgi:hypothetical protein